MNTETESAEIKAAAAMIESRLGKTNAAIRAMLTGGHTLAREDIPGVTDAMVQMLESGLKVALNQIQGKPEPYPGAAERVVLQCLDTIDLTRRAGLLSQRVKR